MLRDLPRYQCIKTVSALRIKAVIPNPRGYELHFEDERYAPHEVASWWVARQTISGVRELPEESQRLIGGYLVVYEDGDQSWSPAAAFEAGYVLQSTGG